MNTLKTDIEGKFPFVLDDLRWQANGIVEALANIAKGFGDKVILWGITATATHYLEGAVFVDDEIFTFEQTALLSENLVLKIAETYDNNGLKEFPNRDEGDRLKNTYAIRKVVLKSYATLPDSLPADEFLFSEFIKLSEFVDNSELINSIAANATSVTNLLDKINVNSAAIEDVDAKILGITETIELPDNLRLDVENGLIKRKWYFVETSGKFTDMEGVELTDHLQHPTVGETIQIKIDYTQGSSGNSECRIEFVGTGISGSPTVGANGITTITLYRYEMGNTVTMKLLEGNNTLATIPIIG